jgi:hypothetical protein
MKVNSGSNSNRNAARSLHALYPAKQISPAARRMTLPGPLSGW